MSQLRTTVKEWMRPSEACQRIGISIPTLRRNHRKWNIHRRNPPGTNVVRYLRRDVEAFIARLEAEEAAQLVAANTSTDRPPKRNGRGGAKKTADQTARW